MSKYNWIPVSKPPKDKKEIVLWKNFDKDSSSVNYGNWGSIQVGTFNDFSGESWADTFTHWMHIPPLQRKKGKK